MSLGHSQSIKAQTHLINLVKKRLKRTTPDRDGTWGQATFSEQVVPKFRNQVCIRAWRCGGRLQSPQELQPTCGMPSEAVPQVPALERLRSSWLTAAVE